MKDTVNDDIRIAIALVTVLAIPAGSLGSEYLGNNQRTGDAACDVPAKPVLHWTYHEQHAPRHAWKEPAREVQFIDFDYADQCTVDETAVCVGSSADHTVRALDLKSGRERWVFYTGGAVRFAPVRWRGRVYVASDDGLIYCLDAAKGTELWQFRPGPEVTKCIGNEQLVSRWPARSGVLIDTQDTAPGKARLYCTGGMWSRDGVVVACLDAATGKLLWRNDTCGFHFMKMPHASGFGGVAPQGYLVRYKHMLYVAAGRAEPAFFNAETGEFVHHETGVGYKPHYPGGSWVMAACDRVWFKRRHNHVEENVRYEERDPGASYVSGIIGWDYATGKPEMALTDKNLAAVKGDTMILAGHGPVMRASYRRLTQEYTKYWRDGKSVAMDPNLADSDVPYVGAKLQKLTKQLTTPRKRTRKGKKARRIPAPAPNWMTPVPMAEWKTDIGRVYTLMVAGDKVLAGGRGRVTLLDIDSGDVLWQRKIEGDARGLAVAPGRFIVSSTAGVLYCFGNGKKDVTREWRRTSKAPDIAAAHAKTAKAILAETGIRAGYCLQLGAGTGGLTTELIRNSDLVVYCLEPDTAKVNALRKALDGAGWLGVRGQVICGSFKRLPFNPYLANLVVCGRALGSGAASVGSQAGRARELYRVTRPYGGAAYCLGRADAASVRSWLTKDVVPNSEVSRGSEGVIVRRGALPGAGEWTHSHADIGRSCSSDDELVRLPVAMLWWGGPGPARIVSRHWRAPVPLFAQGVLFIQGQHDVFAVDAYNGRELWSRHLEGVGRFPPTYRGGNIVTDGARVYCVVGLKCLALEAQTGKTARTYAIEPSPEQRAALEKLANAQFGVERDAEPVWECLAATESRVIGTLGAALRTSGKVALRRAPSQSRAIFAFDKHTGKLAWLRELERTVSPSALASDGERLFVLDRTEEMAYRQARRRGALQEVSSALKAFDLATGRLAWKVKEIPPARKALLCKNGVLVALPSPEEPDGSEARTGLTAFRAVDGKKLWEHDDIGVTGASRRGAYLKHAFACGDTLYLPRAFDLKTGEESLTRRDPVSGAQTPLGVYGQNFCGTISAGKHITAYRSASVGFEELHRDSGSFWLPEVRPSCWISVIPAGGILLAPEGYSTCVCSYNYKTSLALFPESRQEDWGIYLTERPPRGQKRKKRAKPVAAPPVRHLRLNLNAPGDKLDAHNQAWLSYPKPWLGKVTHYRVKGVPVTHEGGSAGFLFNADRVTINGTDRPWLYTSGLTGAMTFAVRTAGAPGARYNLRLHFAELEGVKPGDRQFAVRVQGRSVLERLDVRKEAGAADAALIRAIPSIVPQQGEITIELAPVSGRPPLLCAFEVVQEAG